MRIVALLLGIAAVASAQHEQGKDSVAERYMGSAEAIEAGHELYLTVCSGCHGPTGEGGRGPNLIEGRNVRRASNDELFNSIKNGIPGSDMPPSPLPDDKVWQVAAYVRNLSAPAYLQNAPGNADAGSELFHGKAGCVKCHMIRGQGGYLGPDLTNAGATANLVRLREALLEPNKRFSEGFAPVTVTTKDGVKIKGVAKNNSNYSLQMIDEAGKLHLFDKRDLSEVVFREKSWMPADYGDKLNDKEIENLLAFLSRQAVRAPSRRRARNN